MPAVPIPDPVPDPSPVPIEISAQHRVDKDHNPVDEEAVWGEKVAGLCDPIVAVLGDAAAPAIAAAGTYLDAAAIDAATPDDAVAALINEQEPSK